MLGGAAALLERRAIGWKMQKQPCAAIVGMFAFRLRGTMIPTHPSCYGNCLPAQGSPPSSECIRGQPRGEAVIARKI
eukprot:12916594-Prorocentrum_lima.AAC.1